MNAGLLVVSGLVLVLGVLDDLRSRKIHNHLLLVLLPFVLISVFIFQGWSWPVLWTSTLSFLSALFLGFFLYLAKAIGGGDLKLYAVASLTWDWQATAWILIYALPISLLFGVLRILFKKEGKILLLNLLSLIKLQKVQKTHLQTFPFSVGLLFGWLTYLMIGSW